MVLPFGHPAVLVDVLMRELSGGCKFLELPDLILNRPENHSSVFAPCVEMDALGYAIRG